jgi:site-specific DNA-cytosine methylase
MIVGYEDRQDDLLKQQGGGGAQPSLQDRIYDVEGCSTAITTSFLPNIAEPIICAMRGRNPDNPSERAKSNGRYRQRLEMNDKGTSNTITSVQKDNLVVEPQVLTPKRTEFGKAIRKKYESHEIEMSRHDMTTMEPRTDGVSNTLTSVQKDNYLAIPEATNKGYAEAHEGDSVNLAVPNSKTRRGRVGKQMANTLDTGCQQGVVERYNDTSYGETRVFETINKTNTREVLCLLRSKVGEEAFQRQIGGLIGILKEEILRQGMHEESLCSDRTDIARDRASSLLFTEDSVLDTTETNGVRGMREDNEYRCPSQRPRLSKQFTNEFDTIVSQLPSEDAQTKECVSYLWRACEGSQSLQQTFDTMEEVWGSPAQTVEYIQTPKYRIRKLTVREVFRLMGVDDADIDKLMNASISNSQLYKCAGNSIVVDVLYHIFRKLYIDKGCEQENFQQTLF